MTEAGYRVRGRVQGVGFRWWTRHQATRLGLAGTVRNCADGSVEVHVRGPGAAVAELERLLTEGPPHAHVAAVEQIPYGAAAATSFDVVR
ncbi:MAG TPA: acylphosphatase [Longimicrobiaceae bacterium]|nr:acylphosphatase [Longimicrobiaceae bacterium]